MSLFRLPVISTIQSQYLSCFISIAFGLFFGRNYTTMTTSILQYTARTVPRSLVLRTSVNFGEWASQWMYRVLLMYIQCPEKNTDIFDSKLKTDYQILIIFDTNISDTTGDQITIQFSTALIVIVCYSGKQPTKYCIFILFCLLGLTHMVPTVRENRVQNLTKMQKKV